MALVETETGQRMEVCGLDPAAHLSEAVIEALTEENCAGEQLEPVQQHLQTCVGCRQALRQALQSSGIGTSHSVVATLALAEEWAAMADIGAEATRVAREQLHSQGINPVLFRNGLLLEELADGTVRRLPSEIDSAV